MKTLAMFGVAASLLALSGAALADDAIDDAYLLESPRGPKVTGTFGLGTGAHGFLNESSLELMRLTFRNQVGPLTLAWSTGFGFHQHQRALPNGQKTSCCDIVLTGDAAWPLLHTRAFRFGPLVGGQALFVGDEGKALAKNAFGPKVGVQLGLWPYSPGSGLTRATLTVAYVRWFGPAIERGGQSGGMLSLDFPLTAF